MDIARAIVNNPKILLEDEPTGSIDVNTKSEVLNLFDSLNKDGLTIILIKHDANVANRAKTKYVVENMNISKSTY